MKNALDNMQKAVDKERKLRFEIDLSIMQVLIHDRTAATRDGEQVGSGDLYFTPPKQKKKS